MCSYKLICFKRNSLEKHLADAPSTGRDTTEQATDSVAAKARQGAMCVASLISIPGLGYTVLDIDGTRCDKFLQKIVDHLHKRGD